MYWGGRERLRVGYWWSVLFLVGHLLGTGIIFISLFTIGWLVSVVLHALHRHHPFPHEMFEFVTQIELYLIYVDSAFCGAVLLVGMGRVLQADYGGGAMIDNVLRPIAEGFRGSMVLSKEIIRALLSVFSVLAAYVNAPRISDFNPSRRSE